jgi:hypothetical protein
MTPFSSASRFTRISLAGALALGLATLSGCGVGMLDTTTSPMVMPAIHGQSFGGPNPVIGATVKIYATGNPDGTNGGYGVANLLQEATQQGTMSGQDTNTGGQFSFAGGFNCPAGQFIYIVSSGGNTGGNTVNANAVLVAALGRCEDLFTSTGGGLTGYKGSNVFVNELSTIAAAYALGHFSSVSGTGASTIVGIGAPVTNNAAQISGVSTGCVAGVSGCTTTAAAGLAHAFENAANLVNVFLNTANANLGGTSTGALLPQQLVNSLGNTLVACVNSVGGTAGDSSSCGNIFMATSANSVPPTNTFSAMVNLAANPTLNGSPTACQNFLNLATPQTSVYSPSVATISTVHDLSLAIEYPASAFTAINFPMSGALDINDNYYVGNATYNTGSPGNPTTPVNILSFSSNGATFGSSATNTTLKSAFGLSVDAEGDGYVGNGGGSGTNALGLFPFSNGVTASTALTTSGVITSEHSGNLKVYATAVDQANNVWALGVQQSNGTSNLYMNAGPYTVATAKTWIAQPSPAITIPAANFIGLNIDPDQNVWAAASTTLSVVENSGTVGTPSYTAVSATAATGGSPAVGITFAPSTGPSPYVAWVSSYNTTPGIQGFTPTISGAGVGSITASSLSQPASITGSFFNESDGAGTIWVADTNSSSIQQYNTAAGTAFEFLPCLGGATSCSTVFTSPTKPLTLSVDSAGSIWVASAATGSTAATATPGNIVEIIGSAAPTWPLLSLGKSGTP